MVGQRDVEIANFLVDGTRGAGLYVARELSYGTATPVNVSYHDGEVVRAGTVLRTARTAPTGTPSSTTARRTASSSRASRADARTPCTSPPAASPQGRPSPTSPSRALANTIASLSGARRRWSSLRRPGVTIARSPRLSERGALVKASSPSLRSTSLPWIATDAAGSVCAACLPPSVVI